MFDSEALSMFNSEALRENGIKLRHLAKGLRNLGTIENSCIDDFLNVLAESSELEEAACFLVREKLHWLLSGVNERLEDIRLEKAERKSE